MINDDIQQQLQEERKQERYSSLEVKNLMCIPCMSYIMDLRGFRDPEALGCSDPSAVRALLRAGGL